MTATLIVTVTCQPGAEVLAPVGLTTPHATTAPCKVSGGTPRTVTCANTGQTALVVTADGPTVMLTYAYTDTPGTYTEAMFKPHDSRFTRTAEALLDEVTTMASGDTQLDRAIAIARGTAEKFTYGHPEQRFTDGFDHVPAIGCGMAEGSCVDINTYFIAALRAAGIEAGYVVGAFIPAEKGDWCEDMHCWVVTRIDGACQEWDIAHHLKLGTRKIKPGLNPKPGARFAVGHSMGLTFPDLGIEDLKLLSDPILIDGTFPDCSIRLHQPALA